MPLTNYLAKFLRKIFTRFHDDDHSLTAFLRDYSTDVFQAFLFSEMLALKKYGFCPNCW